MGKFKMPTVKQFLQTKIKCGPKKDPVWVYLEREMRENVDKKPYNEIVGEWLLFLRDLRHHYFLERQRQRRSLIKDIGPLWYCELSNQQKKILHKLKYNIHQDILEDVPKRIRRSLFDLGMTCKLPKKILMKALAESFEDPGIFIWNLYRIIYKTSPSELRGWYDQNAIILMSSLVFIDIEECLKRFEKLIGPPVPPAPKPKKKPKKTIVPNCRYGEYLQTMHVTVYSPHPPPPKKSAKKQPPVLGYKFRVRSNESYMKLCLDSGFLQKRKERNMIVKGAERICHYKFWEPPTGHRHADPKASAYANKLSMIKDKAIPQYKAPFKNTQYQIGGVAFVGSKPQYLLQNVCVQSTGYMLLNQGSVYILGDYVITIGGFARYPRDEEEICDKTCDCVAKWEPTVMKYLNKSKCRCGHLYDFGNVGKVNEKYFYPPTPHGNFWFDLAKIYQMDPMEDFIKDTVRLALMSTDVTPEPSQPTILASGLRARELVAALLADLSDTPLIIPHLPQACLLRNLQVWVTNKIKGGLSFKRHKRLLLKSQRNWLNLKHMDFKARAYHIPFTLTHLKYMNWSHRRLVQKLFNILMNDFVSRNRQKQIEQARLWWPTTMFDNYPSEAFRDTFFTYLPNRAKDIHLINPYDSELTSKYGAKTCPL